ncbi:uncharacterized protein LOC119734470 [Patiria miniata]|uniref:Insulin-like domain-containing protein n=1 Tax=Patiria miniata TaxID=46514 RepID=A0A914AKI0_PATMI|nr:uncharacterized protein LOC119734470 [Patiria miniata]
MNRIILLLLIGACAAAVIADVPKPLADSEIDSNEDGEMETKSGFSVAWTGPQMWVCSSSTLAARKHYVCHPPGRHHHHKREDEDNSDAFLTEDDANTFLASPSKRKANIIHEECCHEGCFWEEILEYC